MVEYPKTWEFMTQKSQISEHFLTFFLRLPKLHRVHDKNDNLQCEASLN